MAGESETPGEPSGPLYGLMGFTHGWAKVLTVTAAGGGAEALARLGRPEGVEVLAGDGALPRLLEKRSGALQRLIAERGIVVLDRAQWAARKAGSAEGQADSERPPRNRR